MGSTLIVNDDVAWMPQRGTFYYTLREIQAATNDIKLHEILAKALEDELAHLDISSSDSASFYLFVKATEKALENLIKSTTIAKFNEECWYLRQVAELKAVLGSDLRFIEVQAASYGEIVINLASSWKVDWLSYNFVFELTAFEIGELAPDLATILLNSRIDLGVGHLDIFSFSKSTFQVFLKAVRDVEAYYLEPFRITARPSFLVQFHLSTLNLVNLLLSDPRASDFIDEHSFEYLAALVFNPETEEYKRANAAWELPHRDYARALEVLEPLIDDETQPFLVRNTALEAL
jgi:hypothetical protein